jgi:hypothetical protein
VITRCVLTVWVSPAPRAWWGWRRSRAASRLLADGSSGSSSSSLQKYHPVKKITSGFQVCRKINHTCFWEDRRSYKYQFRPGKQVSKGNGCQCDYFHSYKICKTMNINRTFKFLYYTQIQVRVVKCVYNLYL